MKNLGRRNAPFRPSGPRHLPPRTLLAAIGLFTIGSVLLSQGVPLWKGAAHDSADEERGLAMVILGSIGTLWTQMFCRRILLMHDMSGSRQARGPDSAR